MRLRLLASVATATLAITLLGSAAQANHSWNGYHWARTGNPFTIQLGDNVSGAWDSVLRTTATDWSQSTVLDTTVVAGSTKARSCKATLGRVQVCNASYGNTGWLGVASISITGGEHITAGTVKLNDTYFNTSTYNTTAWRNLVSCQEVGHTLGLDHQDEDFDNANLNTCMDYTSNPSTNQHPNQHDYAELVDIYTHLDSTTTVGTSPGGNGHGKPFANDQRGWGRQVEGSRHAGHSTFVRSYSDGSSVITFVTWA